MRPFSKREEKILHLATIGGFTIEDAFFSVYKPKNRKIGMTQLATKKKRRPVLFDEIEKYKRALFIAQANAQKEVLIATASANALLAIEKRELLRKIIVGEATEDHFFVVSGKAMKVTRGPSILDRIRAVDLDNKLAGHYPDKGIRHELGDPLIEILKVIGQKSKTASKEDGEIKQDDLSAKNEGSGEIIPDKMNPPIIGNQIHAKAKL